MPPLRTGVRDGQGWGMVCCLREVKKQETWDGRALQPFTIPSTCVKSTERKGGRQPHGL